jgi:hypothetical protein
LYFLCENVKAEMKRNVDAGPKSEPPNWTDRVRTKHVKGVEKSDFTLLDPHMATQLVDTGAGAKLVTHSPHKKEHLHTSTHRS